MYRRTTAKIVEVSKDLSFIKIKLPINYKNRNYANTIFGGSMFSATDPISMVQLIHLLGDDYIVWDKSAEIRFRRPAREDLYAEFVFSPKEVDNIKTEIASSNELEITKEILLTTKDKQTLIAQVTKVIYVADKTFFKEKKKRRADQK